MNEARSVLLGCTLDLSIHETTCYNFMFYVIDRKREAPVLVFWAIYTSEQ
jgi:thioredoxin-like negative regulator of GroEL